MRRLLALCRKELLLLLRDRHGLLVLFAVPTLFILIMSLALQDAFDPAGALQLEVRVVDEDGGAMAQQLQTALTDAELIVAERADITVTILSGFSELLALRAELADDAVPGAATAEPTLLRVDYAPALLPQARLAAGLAVRQAVLSVQTDYLLREVLGYPEARTAGLRRISDARRLPLQEAFIGSDGQTLQPPTSVQQNVPAWLIFAMFFAVIPLATAFVIERSQGSLLRLRALGVPAWMLLASKLLPYYLVNLLQTAVMLAIGVWIVPRLGGDALTLGHSPFGLWLIASATSFAAISLALCVAVGVRTTLQATIAGGALSLILAAIGGVMVPKLVMPPAMQTLTLLSPMAWSLEGHWDIVLREGTWQDVLPEAAALLGFGLLALTLAALLYRRSLTTTHEST